MKIPATNSARNVALYRRFQFAWVSPYAATLPMNAEITVAGMAYSALLNNPRPSVSNAATQLAVENSP